MVVNDVIANEVPVKIPQSAFFAISYNLESCLHKPFEITLVHGYIKSFCKVKLELVPKSCISNPALLRLVLNDIEYTSSNKSIDV